MLKKKLAMLLAVTMVAASLVGCGGSDDSKDTAADTKTEDTADAPADDTADAPADDAADAPADDAADAPADDAADAPADDAASGELIKVGIINNDPSESGYRTANDKDLKDNFTEANGFEASFAYGKTNEEQIKSAEQFIQDGVDYLILSAADTAGWDATLQNAKDNGVEVILFDRVIDASEDLYAASIVSDMEAEGQTAVDWLAKQNLDSYKIVHIQGQMGTAAQIGRTKAIDDKVAAEPDKWSIVVQQTGDWNAEKAQQVMQSVIDSKQEFNVVYAENDDMAKGAVAALDAAGISHGVGKDVIIMGFDTNKWALEELLKQNWNYDGQCNPFQSRYIREVIDSLEAGEAIEEKKIVMQEIGLDASTITQDDVDTYGY